MPSTRFKVIFFVMIGLFLLAELLAYTSFDAIEFDTALDWTMTYFALPILIIMVPSSYFTYQNFLYRHERKKYSSITWTRLRSVLRILILTLGLSFILVFTALSLILLTNAYIGDSKTIYLNATIVDYKVSKKNRRNRYSIKIQDKQLDRIIELKVGEPYQIGQPFNKTMKIGSLGLLYLEK